MSRTTRRALSFDAMEGRLLLSTGLSHPFAHANHHPAAVVRQQRAKVNAGPFLLSGALVGIPFGTVGQDGITVTSFPMKGKAKSMGRVAGALVLTDNVIAPGQQPDLNNATLNLSNGRGGVQVKMASSPSNRHIFIVMAGSGAYASAYGSGTAIITYNQRLHEYQVALRSALR